MLRIETAYQTKNRCYQAAKPAAHIGILVHATGAVNRTLKRYVDAPGIVGVNQYGNHWNNESADKCMHAFIGQDISGEVIAVQTLPYGYACWGCGKGSRGSYNYDPTAHIQFEICQGSDTDAEYYWTAIKAAEEYCAQLCRLFGFAAGDIVSHKEAAKRGYASDHSDPDSWMKHFGDDMDHFRARVAALLAEEQEAPVKMQYIVTGTRLALRQRPTTSAPLVKRSNGDDVRMETGTVLTGEPYNAEWVKVTYEGKTGYSMAKHLQSMEPVEETPADDEPEHELTDKEKLDKLWAWYQEQRNS